MTQASATRPLSVDAEEAGKLVGLSRCGIYRVIASGELASFKAGKRRLILVRELERWVEKLAKENAR